MKFKDKLKEHRIANKLSQQALADAIHVSRSAIAKWENGLGHPSADAMEALTTYFGTDSDYFVSDMEVSANTVSATTEKASPHIAKIVQRFCIWFTAVIGSIALLSGCFILLTQWKCISLPLDGISVEEIYRLPDGRLHYRLDNIPAHVWCSEWEFLFTEDGCYYIIPKRSIVELSKDTQNNQLKMDQLLDPQELNAANKKAGLPQITKWYLGKPGDAILLYEDGMDVPLAPKELLLKYGLSEADIWNMLHYCTTNVVH